MASMVYHSFNQLIKDGFVKLFRSHKAGFADGEQLRDFIYVKDVLQVCYWLMHQMTSEDKNFQSGLYNVGTGAARSFNDLIKAVCSGLSRSPQIEYVDMPTDIRETYQYFTQADVNKLRRAGYNTPFHTIEEGIDDYVKNYLVPNRYF
jgi:ADP-L-glycero-D-manno-heptose 6-epimerase